MAMVAITLYHVLSVLEGRSFPLPPYRYLKVAYLNARLFNTRHIYFVGNFLRQNHLSGQQLAFAIDYWSSGEMEALFLEHEGYCGALGSFLLSGTEESPGTTRSSDNIVD